MTTTTAPTSTGDKPVPGVPLPDDLKATPVRVLRSEWLKFRSLGSSPVALGISLLGMIARGCSACRSCPASTAPA